MSFSRSFRRGIAVFRRFTLVIVGAATISLPMAGPVSAQTKDGQRDSKSATRNDSKSTTRNDSKNAAKPAKPAKPASKATAQPRPAKSATYRSKPLVRDKGRHVTGLPPAAPRKNRPPVAVAPGRIVSTSIAPPARMTIGQAIGLHRVDDPLDLKSGVALVVDQESGETLYEKNPTAVLPIASITKLMTALVTFEAGLPLDAPLTITEDDRDTERHSSSRLRIGAQLSRREMLQLALMSSENRAAHALGRHHTGGLGAFVEAMNRKARELGMTESRFADPTGLSGSNVSTARDLALLVRASYDYPEIRQYSTANGLYVDTGARRPVGFHTTNRLVDAPDWDIGLQKTGYISEAGRCLVMQASIDGRGVIIVLLDAAGSHYRMADAQKLRKWLRTQPRDGTDPVARGRDAKT